MDDFLQVARIIARRNTVVSRWESPGDSLRKLRSLRHGYFVSGLTVSMDGKRLISGGRDRQVKVWDLASEEVSHSFGGTRGYLSENGDRLMTTRPDEDSPTIVVRDPLTGETRLRLTGGHLGRVTAGVFSPDGRRFASGDVAGYVRMWDVESGRLLW